MGNPAWPEVPWAVSVMRSSATSALTASGSRANRFSLSGVARSTALAVSGMTLEATPPAMARISPLSGFSARKVTLMMPFSP